MKLNDDEIFIVTICRYTSSCGNEFGHFCPIFLRISAFDVALCFLNFVVIVNKTPRYTRISFLCDVDDGVPGFATRV